MGKLLKKEERNNQFKNILSSDDRLEDMKKSISEFGILMPIIVRVKEEKTLR